MKSPESQTRRDFMLGVASLLGATGCGVYIVDYVINHAQLNNQNNTNGVTCLEKTYLTPNSPVNVLRGDLSISSYVARRSYLTSDLDNQASIAYRLAENQAEMVSNPFLLDDEATALKWLIYQADVPGYRDILSLIPLIPETMNRVLRSGTQIDDNYLLNNTFPGYIASVTPPFDAEASDSQDVKHREISFSPLLRRTSNFNVATSRLIAASPLTSTSGFQTL